MYDTQIWRKQLKDQPLDDIRKKQIASRLDEIDGVLNQQLSDLKKMGPQHLLSILTKVYSDNADLSAREQFEPYFGQDEIIQKYGSAERALNIYMRSIAWVMSAVKGQNFGTNQVPQDYPPIVGAILHDLGVAWGSRVLYELKVRSLEKIVDNLKTASKKGNWADLQKEAYNAKNVAETCLSDTLKQRDKAEADFRSAQKSLQDLTKELSDEKSKYSKEQVEHAATKKKWLGWARQIIGERKSAKKDLATKTQELADKTAVADAAIKEKDATVKAKDTAETNFADLKPKYEKLGTDYSEVMKRFSAATATATEMLGENTELYEQVKDLNKTIKGLEAAFKVERERADDLYERVGESEIAHSETKSKVRIGWYSAVGATAAAAVLAFLVYATPSQPSAQVAKVDPPAQVAKVDPPKVEQKPVPPKVEPPKLDPKPVPPKVDPPKVEPPKIDPPKVEIKPVPPSLVEPRNESMRYLMGAYLLELPDNQFVISSKKDAELEKRAKSVRYLASAYIVELDNKQFALTDDGKSLLENNIKNEKVKLGRDLKVAEKKVLYEKFAARYIN